MKTVYRSAVCVLLALLWSSTLVGWAKSPPEQDSIVTPNKADGVYALDEPIHWRIEWRGGSGVADATFSLKAGGRTEVDRGKLTFVDNVAELDAKSDQPGALLAEFAITTADGKQHKALGGAIVAPEQIVPSAPCPDDFDAFWESKLAEIAALPLNPQLAAGESGSPRVEYWKITLDNVDGTHIRGQLAKPARDENTSQAPKLPAMLIPQWAGVYQMEKPWAVGRAQEGWLVLNILAHDLPIDEPAEFYQQQSAGPLKDYWTIGNDDRDKSYFLRMYLACYRAAEYLTTRPDWDGKMLVVCGASQGGQQTLATAALHPRVTAAMAIVPAGCDMLGPNVGRSPGWPKWYELTAGKDPAKVREASRYFDPVNFAARIRCPVLVGFGLIDQVCPPEGVMAAVNQIPGPKEFVPLPLGEHQETSGSHAAYYKRLNEAWLPALHDGTPVPVDR